jgi:predicted GNAT family acetyltransferase
MTEPSAPVVTRNDSAHRYEATLDGVQAGFIDFRVHGGHLVLMHTETDPAFAGRGVGTALAIGALSDIRARGEKAVVYCPFIKSYLARHPGEWDDVVDSVQ